MTTGKELEKAESRATVPQRIDLMPTASIDISYLSEEQQRALRFEHAKGMINLTTKAQELNMEAAALRQTLDDLTSTAKSVAEDGNVITATTSIGRTQVTISTPKMQGWFGGRRR